MGSYLVFYFSLGNICFGQCQKFMMETRCWGCDMEFQVGYNIRWEGLVKGEGLVEVCVILEGKVVDGSYAEVAGDSVRKGWCKGFLGQGCFLFSRFLVRWVVIWCGFIGLGDWGISVL